MRDWHLKVLAVFLWLMLIEGIIRGIIEKWHY